jgi:hypothetical protein
MTEEPSLAAIEYDRASTREIGIAVERLEFGKFCVSSNGPIESNRDNIPIGYSQLCWSNGFPSELISSCHPTNLGIAKEGTDVLPRENSHGTVLRPVVRGGKGLRSLFYRVRSRAEDGEGQSGRRYTLARYLAVPEEGVNPLSLLAALNSVPLEGITRAAARDISPLESEPEHPALDHVAEAFLREALIYILSGVALSITDEISEAKFFALVAAVHERLPPVLRPHLSSGWNVGSSYSGKLGITYTTHRAGSAALFSPTTLTWSSPEYVTTWNAQHKPVVNTFFDARLEPGRLFERYIFREANHSDSSSSVSERLSNLVGSLPRVEVPELPDWNDPVIVRIFRYPGLQARDQFAIRALAEWLATGEENAEACLDARALSYQSNRLKALELILQGLSEPSSKLRADHALWLSITGKVPISFTNVINGWTGIGADRARLIAAIGSNDVFKTLSAFQLAAPDERQGLPAEVVTHLFKILDQSLVTSPENVLPYHSRLLLSPSSQYHEWVNEHSLELIRALGLQQETPQEALTAIADISGSDTIRALHSFMNDQTLTPVFADLLRRLQPAERSVFIELFNHRWSRQDELTAVRRQRLLDWLRVLNPPSSRHPLLRLEAGAELTDLEVADIADDVERQHVPESLLPAVAELALQKWAAVGRRITSRVTHWRPVTNRWPREHARVLGMAKGTDAPDPHIVRAAQQFRIKFADLEHLLTIWLGSHKFADAAPLLWDWSIQLEPRIGSPLTALDLCRHFENGRLPDAQLDSREFDRFVILVKGSGRGKIPSEVVQNMWRFALRFWQVKLLLTLFPQENLEANLSQLSLLVPQQAWLATHLRDPQVHALRRDWFKIATVPFQSLSFRESPMWRDDFINSPLRAAFRGVPASMLPTEALRRALRAYAGSAIEGHTAPPPENIIEEQARLCLTFLRSYKGAASENDATLKVLFEFVLPLFRERWSKEHFTAVLAGVGADLKLPGYERTDKYRGRFSPSMYELLSEILILTNAKSLSYCIKEFYKQRNAAQRRH